MNEAQSSRLLVTFRRLDELLAEAVARLGPGATERLFPPWVADAAPIQRKRSADYARRLRSAMRAALDRLGLAMPSVATSGVWSARALLMEAQVAVAELEPSRLGGYGEVSDADARELRAMIAELSNWLDELERYLAQGPSEALAVRLRRIGINGPDTDALAELERIISAHGLIGFHSALEQLAERLATQGLEVAVFGRVKAGKSSLLNRLLDTDVLPIGVVPMTEIPVRITHGAAPLGRAEFTDAAAETFDLARLAEFVTAQQNPGNVRHVTRLTVELPAPLLKDGITFVDTPGVGLAENLAAAETWAYLPRCDLGLVLVDAAATLTDADVALVDALRHAGAETQVLLAKADLLSGQDLERSLDFIRRQLAERLGADVPVHPVSARDETAALTDRWRESALRPLLADGRRLAAAALARKFALLRDGVRSALARRLAATAGGDAAAESARWRERKRVVGEALARLGETKTAPPEEIAALAGLNGTVLDEAAHNSAVIWHQSGTRDFDATALIEAAAQSHAGVAASAAARQIGELRALARAALAEADRRAPEDLPRAAGLPVMDVAGALPRFIVHRPTLFGLAGEAGLRLALRHRMRDTGLEQALADVYRSYGRQLESWRQAALDELTRAFVAQRELALGVDAGDPAPPAAGAELAADIRRIDAINVNV